MTERRGGMKPLAAFRAPTQPDHFRGGSGLVDEHQSVRFFAHPGVAQGEALLRIAVLYKVEDTIRGSSPDHRRAVRQDLSCPLVDEFFTRLKTQAAGVSRKSDFGEVMAYMLKRQDGFPLFQTTALSRMPSKARP